MGFQARVYIQGVGHLRPSDDGSGLEAYFPNFKIEREFKLFELAKASRRPSEVANPQEEICEHHYFAQFSAQCLGQTEDVWLTLMLDRSDVVVETSGPRVNSLYIGPGGHIEGIANLSDLLDGIVPDPRKLRSDLAKDKATLLDGFLGLDRGKARGFAAREWQVILANGAEQKISMSGIVLVELGEVEELALRVTSFDRGETRLLRLFPKATTKDVDLWIRHYCDLSRPDFNPPDTLKVGYTDWDFLLNYALIEGIGDLSEEQKKNLPLPTIKDGGQIGGNHTICQGTT